MSVVEVCTYLAFVCLLTVAIDFIAEGLLNVYI